MKKPNSRLLKIVAWGLVFAFSVNTAAWSAPAVSKEQASDQVSLPALAQTLQIPESLGTIQERFSPAQSVSTLIHIQDAHSNLSAQDSIRKILHALTQQYPVDEIYLEGALGELDPSLLDFFKDEKLNQKTAGLLEQKALLGGTERFLLDQRQSGKAAAGHGVEDAALYGNNLQQFRDVYLSRDQAETYLAALKTQILTEASRVFNKDLRDFFKEWIFCQDNPEEMRRHFDALEEKAGKVLRLDFHQAEAQAQWPQLARFVRVKSLEGKADAAKAQKEKSALEAWIQEQGPWGNARNIKEDFQESLKAVFSPGIKVAEPRVTAEKFFHAAHPKGFSFETYPELSKSLGKMILENELDAEAMFSESQKLTRLLFEKLTRNSQERKLLERYERYGLLKKLLALELTRPEYLQIAENPEAYRPSHLDSSHEAVNTVYEQALSFYETALRREEAIEKRVTRQMVQNHQTAAVLITGGFHSEGLGEKFKQRGIAYVEILPRIADLKNNNQYLNVMTLGAASAANNHPSYIDLPALQESLPAVGAFYARETGAVLEEVRRENPGAADNRTEARKSFSQRVSEIPDKELRGPLTAISNLIYIEGSPLSQVPEPQVQGTPQEAEVNNYRNSGHIIAGSLRRRQDPVQIAQQVRPYFEAVIKAYDAALAKPDVQDKSQLLKRKKSREALLPQLPQVIRMLADQYEVAIPAAASVPPAAEDPMAAFTAQFSPELLRPEPSAVKTPQKKTKAAAVTKKDSASFFQSRRVQRFLGLVYPLVFNWVSFVGLSAFAWYLFYRYQENEIFGVKVEAENENQKLVLSLFRFLMVAGGAAVSILPVVFFKWMRTHGGTSIHTATPVRPTEKLQPRKPNEEKESGQIKDEKKHSEMRVQETPEALKTRVIEAFQQMAGPFFSAKGYQAEVLPGFPDGITVNLYPADPALRQKLYDQDLGADLDRIEVPFGTVAQLKVSLIEVNGGPALFIDELHPSAAYRNLLPLERDTWSQFQSWADHSVELTIKILEKTGLPLYAKSPNLARLQNLEMGHGSADRYYNKPFSPGLFRKTRVLYKNYFHTWDEVRRESERDLREYGRKRQFLGGEGLLWHYEPHIWVNAAKRPQQHALPKKQFKAVQNLLNERIVKTPLQELPGIGQAVHRRVFLKDESFQKTGSFKYRGVYAEILAAIEKVLAEPDGGLAKLKLGLKIVTQSTGNHGIALIWATGDIIQELKHREAYRNQPEFIEAFNQIEPFVFTLNPKKLPGIKFQKMQESLRHYRAITQNERGAIRNEFNDYAGALRARTNFIEASPSNRFYMEHGGKDIILGHGSAGLEIVEQLREAGIEDSQKVVVIIPVGAGGPLGVGAAAKEARKNTQMVMVQSTRWDAFVRTLKTGNTEQNDSEVPPTDVIVEDGEEHNIVFADGIAVDKAEGYAATLAQEYADAAIAVDERKAYDEAGPLLASQTESKVGGTTALTLQALLEFGLDVEAIRDADAVVLFGTEGNVDPLVTRHLSQLSGQTPAILEPYARRFAAVREERAGLIRAENRNPENDEAEAIKVYLKEDPSTRMNTNLAARELRTAVGENLEAYIEAVNHLKTKARADGTPIGVVNQMLFETTRDDETLRRKVSDYYETLFAQSQEEEELSVPKREALNAIFALGIGHVLTESPELDDAKAGGMADVLTELYPALTQFGVSVTRVTLGYREKQTGKPGENGRNPSIYDLLLQHRAVPSEAGPLKVHIGPLKISGTQDALYGTERDIIAEVFHKRDGDLETVYLYNPKLTRVLYPSRLSGKELLELTLFLSRGTLEYARQTGLHPRINITNDWMTDLIPLYLRVDPFDTSYKNDIHFREMLTLPMGHNMGKAYQMRISTNTLHNGTSYDIFPLLNVSGEHYDGLSDPEDRSHFNLVRGAFTHADGILLVSPGYLKENLKPGSVSGLDWLLREKAQVSGGISNGLDRKWLEEFDLMGREMTGLAPYSGPKKKQLEEFVKRLPAFKAKAKEKVQSQYPAPDGNDRKFFGYLEVNPDRELISMAARLADQKGVELLIDGIQQTLDQSPNAQIVIAGSVPNTDEGTVEQRFKQSMLALAQNPKYAGRFVFHPEFINPKLLLLASDGFLMPSKDEPGGIAQLQALLAGAAVIGREVGGIANTVRQFKPSTLEGDGFLFRDFTVQAFVKAAALAARTLRLKKAREAIIKNAATSDNFWDSRVPYYLAFMQKMTGVLNYDYPHLAKARQLIKEIQPHIQPVQGATPPHSEARRSEHRVSKVKAGKMVDGTFSPAQQMRSEEDWGIADFKTMRKSVVLAQKLGQKIVQLLPMSMPKAFDSPYAAVSARLLDPANISIPAVLEDLAALGIPSSEIPGLNAFLEQKREEILKLNTSGRVDRQAIEQLKREALQFVWTWFQKEHPAAFAGAYQNYLDENGAWLEEDILYLQLLRRFSAENPSAGWDWRAWAPSIRDRDPEVIAKLKTELASEMQFEYFVQFIANRQFDALVDYGRKRNVEFMEDTPLAPGEADTWIRPYIFGLKKENGYRRLVSQGVPPDPFSFFGQYWQFFAYDFTHPETETYLLDLFRFKQKRFSYIRLDHVLGYYRQYLFTEDPDNHFTLEKLGLFSEIQAVRQQALEGHLSKRDAGYRTLDLIKQRLLQLRQFKRTGRLPDGVAPERQPFFEAALKSLPEDALELLFDDQNRLLEDQMLAIFRETPEAERGKELPDDSTWKREYRVEPKRQEDYTPLEVGKKDGYDKYVENYLFGDAAGISPNDKLTLGYFKLAPGESILSKYIRLAQEQDTVMIWEVLGVVPPVIQASVNRLAGAYSYFPVIWGLSAQDAYHPNQMASNAYATFDLHDSKGLRSRWEEELTRDQRREILNGIFGEGHYDSEDLEKLTEKVQFGLLEMVYAPWRFMTAPEGRESVSMAVLTWSALLGLPDEGYRLNIPGQIGQWVNRLPREVTLENLILAADGQQSTPEASRTVQLIRRLQDSRNTKASAEVKQPLFLRADPDTGRNVFQIAEFSEIPEAGEQFLLDVYTGADAKKVTARLNSTGGETVEVELSPAAEDAGEGLIKWTAFWQPPADDLKETVSRHYSFTVEVTDQAQNREVSPSGDLIAVRKGADLNPSSSHYVLQSFFASFTRRTEMRSSAAASTLQDYLTRNQIAFTDVSAVSGISQQTFPAVLSRAAVEEALARVREESKNGKEQGAEKINALKKTFTEALRNAGYGWLADSMEQGVFPEHLVLPVEAGTSIRSLAELALLSGVQKVDILVSGISERDSVDLQREANQAVGDWGGVRAEFQLRVHAAPEAQDIRRLSQRLLSSDLTSSRGMASSRKEDLEGVLAMRGVQPMHSEKLKKQYDLILMIASAYMRDQAQARTLGKILDLDRWLEERHFDAGAFSTAMLSALKAIESAA